MRTNNSFGFAHNIYLCILTTAVLLLLILFPVYIKEDSASAVTGTATASSTSLTLTTNHTSANVAITPNSANGTFAMSSTAGEAQFGVTTNNFTGYELSIVADDDSGNLTNTDGNVGHSIFSIDTPMTKDSFDTTTYNNRWGYKPNKYVSNNVVIDNTGDSALFLPSPTTTGTILDHTTVANSSANNYSIALGIRADHNTYAGTYTKTFTLVATANPTTYTINYNKNTTDSVSNLPSTSTAGSTSSITINLPNTVPTRAHYSFLGWCSTTTTTSNGIDSCSGTVYNPNGAGTNLTYGLDQTTANTVTLYAMWELEKFTITLTTTGGANGIIIDGANYSGSSASLAYGNHTISGSYASGYEFDSWSTSGSISVASTSSTSTTLTVTSAGTLTLSGKQSLASIQSITLATCPTTATQVYDTRDNEIYTIQKLADGKCWLLDNLRLDLTDATVKNNLTANTTNASNTTLNYLKNGGGTTSDQYATAGVANWDNNYSYKSYSTPLIATSDDFGKWTKDTTQPFAMGQSGTGKIGVYYNYCAASAGSYCYGDGTSSGSPSGNATEDICPKGWRMPTGGDSGEYQALYAAYSSNDAAFVNALRTPLSGYVYNGSASGHGSYGFFWSSTYYEVWTMRSLYVDSSTVYPRSSSYRYDDNPVRCVLQASDISQISTMQDFATNNATAIKNSMTTGQAYTLTDSRDGTSYTVSKLADGKVWLLDNLSLDLTNSTVKAKLSSTNTNASNTTLNYLKNGGGTTSNKYATAGVANWTSSYSYSAPLIATSGTGNNGDWTKDTLQSYGSGSGKIGVYYNYCAASAGSYCYGNGTSEGSPSGNATEDICPAGWRMPTGGSGEYRSLFTAYSSNATNFKNALRTPLSGLFSYGSAYLQGSDGTFWSSTYLNSGSMYSLRVGSSSVYPQYNYSRSYGCSVRCVLQ